MHLLFACLLLAELAAPLPVTISPASASPASAVPAPARLAPPGNAKLEGVRSISPSPQTRQTPFR